MSAKYYDLKGKSALDVTDPDALTRINRILNDMGIDTNRFKAIGIEMDYFGGKYYYKPLCFDTLTQQPVKLILPTALTEDNFHYIADWFSAYVVDDQYQIQDIRKVTEHRTCVNSISISRTDFDLVMGNDMSSLISQIQVQQELLDHIKNPETCVYLKDEDDNLDSHLLVWQEDSKSVHAYPKDIK